MKNLKQETNEQIHEKTLEASRHEKTATLMLLDYLAEVDRRRLYAEKSYPTLWTYVHEFLGYSESQTTERVQAMRLMTKHPEVKSALNEGKVSLTSTARLASHVYREKSSPTETLHLLKEIVGKSSREVEKHLSSKATVETQVDKMKVITQKTTRIIIDVDEEFLILLKRVRELKGHHGSLTQDLIKTTLKEFVKRNEPQHTKVSPRKTGFPHSSTQKPLRAPEAEAKKKINDPPAQTSFSRYIPIHIRHRIRLRSGDQCEFIESKTQRRCSERIKLEFDHIVPYQKGGSTTYENLRHYCVTHNQLAAIKEYGASHMSKFMKI